MTAPDPTGRIRHLADLMHRATDASGDPIPAGSLLSTDGSDALEWIPALEAADIPFTPAGTIAATDVQAAIEEVASEAGSGVTLSDDTPLVESASGDPGTSGEASRSDHVHPDDGGGGGGGSAAFYLDTYSLPRDATYGDDFDGASLDARWTRKNIVSGQEHYQDGDGSWMRVDMAGTSTAAQQYQQTLPGGDWDFVCSMTFYVQGASATMYGLVAYDNSGNGLGPVAYVGDHNTYLGLIASYTYSSNGGGIVISVMPNAKKLWYRLKKVSTTYTAYISLDGMTWSRGPTRTDATTFTKIAFGRIYGGTTDEEFVVDMFDRVA